MRSLLELETNLQNNDHRIRQVDIFVSMLGRLFSASLNRLLWLIFEKYT